MSEITPWGMPMNDNTRNYALDLFRIIAMLMITALHVNWQHLDLLRPELPMPLAVCGYLIEYTCFAGVDCFAILSGFLLGGKVHEYDRKWLKNCLSFWLKMTFWSVVLYAAECCILRTVAEPDWCSMFIVPLNKYWWSISAYAGLLIFMPLLGKGIRACGKKELPALAGGAFLVFSILPVAGGSEGASALDNGYSVIWLAICFIYGGVLKEFMPQILRMKNIYPAAVVATVLSVILPCMFHLAGIYSGCVPDGRRFMSYLSPFCVLEAAGILILCHKIQIRKNATRRIVTFLSVNSLGIYLLQTYPFVWNNFVLQSGQPVYSAGCAAGKFIFVFAALNAAGIFANVIVEKLFTISRLKNLPEFVTHR